MSLSDYRAKAREALAGKWGKVAALSIIFFIITYIITYILKKLGTVGSLAITIIDPVLSFGYLLSIIKITRDENVSYVDFLKDGFKNFTKVWGVTLYTLLKILIPILIMITAAVIPRIFTFATNSTSSTFSIIIYLISTIIYIGSFVYLVMKYYYYSLTYFILADNPDLPSKEIVEKSEKLMQGNRLNLFLLGLTFIGWILLGIITLGIGLLWIMPYISVSQLKFYEELNNSTPTEEVKDEPIKE